MKTPITVLILLLLAALPLCAQQDTDSKSPLQQAFFAEEAERLFDKAAEGHERIIGNDVAERGFALVAIYYRLAEVRRRQGRDDEAARLYQRILSEFPDSDPQARLSAEMLETMGIAVGERRFITALRIPRSSRHYSQPRQVQVPLRAPVRPIYVAAALRAKLEDEPADPQHLLTVRGIGYRLRMG